MSAYIFLLFAVMSRDAFMIRSRRSWCVSSSDRKVWNMGMYGDVDVDVGVGWFVAVCVDGFAAAMLDGVWARLARLGEFVRRRLFGEMGIFWWWFYFDNEKERFVRKFSGEKVMFNHFLPILTLFNEHDSGVLILRCITDTIRSLSLAYTWLR